MWLLRVTDHGEERIKDVVVTQSIGLKKEGKDCISKILNIF